MMYPFSQSVTITNLTFGNLNSMDKRAFGDNDASVHTYEIGYGNFLDKSTNILKAPSKPEAKGK